MQVNGLRILIRRCPIVGIPVAVFALVLMWLWHHRTRCLVFVCISGVIGLLVTPLRQKQTAINNSFTNINYSVVDLGTLTGDSASGANAINEKAQIVGWSEKQNRARHAFLWQNGSMIDLHKRSERNSEAAAINRKGWIVGWFGEDAYTSSRPCLWQGKQMRNLGTVAKCAFGNALSVNDKGQIVGVSYNSKQGARVDVSASLWQNGSVTDLRPLLDDEDCEAACTNSKGQFVGWVQWMRDYSAFLYDKGQKQDLATLGGDWCFAICLNDTGQVAGQADVGPEGSPGYGYVSHACLWQNRKVIDLGTLGGGKSEARSY